MNLNTLIDRLFFLCLKKERKEQIAMKKRCGNLVRDAPKA